MIIVISPSKSIDFSAGRRHSGATAPRFAQDAASLMELLRGFGADEIARTDRLSIRMALSCREFIQTFPLPSTPEKEAIFAYSGNVYGKLNAATLSETSLEFLQRRLCILSALYGLLHPLDRIKPYRLDMASKLIPDLYGRWKDKVTATLAERLEANGYVLVNLASAEYFRMIRLSALPARTRIITPVFRQEKNGKLTTNSLFAKQARGLMVRFIAENQTVRPEDLQLFCEDGYFHNPLLSDGDTWCFTKY
jgi:cytoplasmic iron level regulating protein YaaA (DUF328/UPF0246 family)